MKNLPILALLAAFVLTESVFAQDGNSGKTKELTAILASSAPLFDKARACQRLGEIGDKTAVPALARLLSDEIGPGESFRVFLPFRLPGGATPAGLVMHHGDVPGVAIVGADQSLLHQPALQRVALGQPR